MRPAQALIAVVLSLSAMAATAAAHPAGTDAVDHFSVLSVRPDGLRIYHLFYMAETPTGAMGKEIDADKDGMCSAEECDAWAKKKADEFAGKLKVTLAGKECKVAYVKHRLRFDPSPVSGLPELSVFYTFEVKWEAKDVPAAGAEPATLVFRDDNLKEYRGRWKTWYEAADGVEVTEARKSDKFDRTKNPFAEYTAKSGQFDDDEAAIRFRRK
jgi:hypothetical protein